MENEILLSDLPLPSIRSSSRSNANNSFKNIGDICEVFAQVRYFVKTLVGEARLPSAVDMEKDRQVNPVLLEIEKKINIVVSGQVHLALQKIRQYWTSQEEIRYRREVLGMPDKYFHKMGTLQVALIGNNLHT